jgi:hypothetical protein
MTITTNMPPTVFDSNGVTFQQPDVLLNGACLDIQGAFNNQLNLDATVSSTLITPQGQIASTQTAVRLEKDANVAFITNQFNPATCLGIWQDGMGKFFYNMQRLPALPTIVSVTCTGLAGVIIPAGATVTDVAGNIYASSQAGTIDISGTVDIDFSCTITGAVSCPAGAITSIYNNGGAIGWDTATNADDGILGQDVETQQAFETRRQLSIGIYGHSMVSSIVGNIYRTVEGIEMVYAMDNDTSSPVTVLGVTMPAHSLYVSAVGGTDLAVATAIFNKKSGGCAYEGNTLVTVQDTDSYNTPYPATTVKFTRPDPLPVYFAIEALDDSTLPATRDTLIKNAVLAQFSGTNGSAKAQTGSLIHAGKYYAPIQAAIPDIVINSLFVGGSASPTTPSLQVNADEYPTLNTANIAITWV